MLSGFTWEVPGPGAGVMKHVLGGWNVSGVLRYESGRPMTVTMNNDLAGLLFNTQKRPNQVGEGMADFGDFDPFHRSLLQPRRLGGSGPASVRERARARWPRSRLPAISARTSTSSRSSRSPTRRSSASRQQVGNLFNRTVYCNPASNFSGTDFGQVFTQCNTARSVQLGFRFDF